MMLRKIPNIVVVIEDASSYCRDLIKGISRYAQIHGPWTIYRDIHNSSFSHGRSVRKEFNEHLQNINCDGLITRAPLKTVKISRRGVPTIIAITENNSSSKTPRLAIDHEAVGEMGANYFIEKGYKNFAFYGDINLSWAKRRYHGFRNAILAHDEKFNINCYNYSITKMIKTKGYSYKMDHLAQWLSNLPKPTALMACSDAWAVNVFEAAKLAQIYIPEQLSVVGVDNDEPVCNTCFPQLSSICLNGEIGGFKMAELLDRLMKGEKSQGQTIQVKPVHVVTRTSTEIMAVEDNLVSESIQFIRSNRREPIQVCDVAEAVNSSLRTLQNKFRKNLGRTILDEIRNIRISYAKELLLNSDMNISQISDYLNFPGVNSFSRFFKNETGLSPLEYRREYGRF